MRTKSLPRFCLLLILLLGSVPTRGQVRPDDPTASQAAAPVTGAPQSPRLSPGAEEVAKELGVYRLIERLYQLPESDRGAGGGTMTLEALSLRQEITEIVTATSLEIDGVIAEIDNETDKLNLIRADLEARRDRAQKINNIANIVTGGLLGVVGTALQFKDSTMNLGNAIGLSGGAASVVLSVIGIRQQGGGRLPLGRSPNMLAMFFGRQPEFHSTYPEEVWAYLNAARPAELGAGTRRAQLMEEWKQSGRIDKSDTPKGQSKIAALTSGISQQRPLTIDQIIDREAMLGDVRAQVSLMKRDLSKLMLALRPSAR